MKILYTTDLHGDDWKFKLLVKAASHLKPDVVINGGDMLPKGDHLFRQKEYISHQLSDHFKTFNDMGIYYLCYPGNDDLKIFDNLFEETCNKYPFTKYLAQKKVKIGGYDFIGMNWVVDYPFRLKDRCRKDTKSYQVTNQFGTGLYSQDNGFKEIKDWKTYIETQPTIEDELMNLEKPDDFTRAIYVVHMPPAHLGLDCCINGERVGSIAVYDFIKNSQPKLTLHGHIHESPDVSGKWCAAVDKTICIQPGQGAALRDFVFITVDLDTMDYQRRVE
jgi:Icc-related predicted phosphoesterase